MSRFPGPSTDPLSQNPGEVGPGICMFHTTQGVFEALGSFRMLVETMLPPDLAYSTG